MFINSINGDDEINILCNHAMRATLIALNNEGHVTADEVDKFLDNHIAVLVTHNGGWMDWLKRKFGKEPPNVVVVCKTYTHAND